MRIGRSEAAVFQVTIGAYELAALVAAARWVLEGAEGELPPEARDQLRETLESYDAEARRLRMDQPPGFST